MLVGVFWSSHVFQHFISKYDCAMSSMWVILYAQQYTFAWVEHETSQVLHSCSMYMPHLKFLSSSHAAYRLSEISDDGQDRLLEIILASQCVGICVFNDIDSTCGICLYGCARHLNKLSKPPIKFIGEPPAIPDQFDATLSC